MSASLPYGQALVPVSLPHGAIAYATHCQPSDFATSDMEMLGHGSPYGLLGQPHDRSVRMTSPVAHGGMMSGRHHPYGSGTLPSSGASPPLSSSTQRSGNSSSGSGPVRRRISRACDQCNQLRTKCDGQSPCAHCIGTFGAQSTSRCHRLTGHRIRPRLRIHA